jgi:hypothetical protein
MKSNALKLAVICILCVGIVYGLVWIIENFTT